MKEMETNTTEVRLTYFCRFRVPSVMYIITVIFRSRRLTISFPFGSGIIIATTSSTPARLKWKKELLKQNEKTTAVLLRGWKTQHG